MPGFGGAPLGNLFQPIADDDARLLIRHAYASGIRYFDTAPHYGQGMSEHRVGAALRDFPRDSYFLSTKVGRLLTPSSEAPKSQNGYVDVLPFVQHYDYTHDGVLRSLEDSLQRLGLARVDIALLHDVNPRWHGERYEERFREAMDGGYRALERLRAEGVADYAPMPGSAS